MILHAVSAAARAGGLDGRRALVAVSGGVDSTVLLHVLWSCRGALELDLCVGHVNHGLRGAESDADEALVAALAAKLALPFHTSRVDPEALRRGRSSRSRPTLQEAARRARYDALGALAAGAGADAIVTAHTADDQAETVLLRLLRGAGPDGLGGIPERSPDGRLVRPLLGVSRAQLLAYAAARGLAWREDPSNRSEAYARARLRAHWLPGLAEAFNPRLLRAIADLAEAQRRDSEWIDASVQSECARRFRREGAVLRIAPDGLAALPEALARRVARQALREAGAGREVSRAHIRRTLDFLQEARVGRRIELPGGLELLREAAGFRLGPRESALQPRATLQDLL